MNRIGVLLVLFSMFVSTALFADDHGNSTSSATYVGTESITSGAIETAGDNDYFRVYVPTSGTLTVYTTGSLDTYGYLLNSSGTTLATDDDSASGTNFGIAYNVAAGTYYVRVRAYSSSVTGSYALNVTFGSSSSTSTSTSDDHGGSLSTATYVPVNSSVAGSIEVGGDNDYFRITLPSSGTLSVYSNGSLDTYGYLLNSSGTTLLSDDDSGSGTNFQMVQNLAAGTYYVRLRAYSSSSVGSYTFNVAFSATSSTPAQKVVLLLHGLASSPDTWNDLVSSEYGNNCPVVRANAVLPSRSTTSGVACYRAAFGAYDYRSLAGLENQQCNVSSGCAGDYSTFNTLGREVREMIGRIRTAYSNDVEVLLLGHSRGGLAARAFLQESFSSVEKSSVEGLLTTGTPHLGSPLGRFYKYLQDNCSPRALFDNDNGACEDDWEVVDLMLGERFYSDEYQLDLRVPSIDFLSPDSSQIASLYYDHYLLSYLDVDYAQMVYSGVEFGHLKGGLISYSLFGFSLGDHPSSAAEAYVLDGYSLSVYNGDSVVPEYSQRYGAREFFGTEVRHTEEPGRIADLRNQLNGMKSRLGW